MKYTVLIDNDDAADAPDKPWTATVNEPGSTQASGIGATPAEALLDLAQEWMQEEAMA
jgi:predicted RNase H-like HicB family nuclease